MKETLETINRMQADGVIGKYAIGGAVGATYYLEPIATLNLEVFITPASGSRSSSTFPTVVYEYLARFGYQPEDECIIIGSWPVKFLTAANELEKEVHSEAFQTDGGGVLTSVAKAEHLVAIALQSGRPKDYELIIKFIEHEAIDSRRLDDILARHGMLAMWEKFKKKFPEIPQITDARRKQLASLAFSEKWELLEKLRERYLMLAEAREHLAKKSESASNFRANSI